MALPSETSPDEASPFSAPAGSRGARCGDGAQNGQPSRASQILAQEDDVRLEWVEARDAAWTVGGSTYRVCAGDAVIVECSTRPEAERAYRRALEASQMSRRP